MKGISNRAKFQANEDPISRVQKYVSLKYKSL